MNLEDIERVISVPKDVSDKELERVIFDRLPSCMHTGKANTVMLDGYNDDDRELWDIPEAVAVLERMVSTGFISILEPTSHLEGIRSDHCPAMGLGAFEVWAATKNLVGVESRDISQETLRHFFTEVLPQANKRAERVVVSRMDTRLVVNEGQQKLDLQQSIETGRKALENRRNRPD